MDSFIVWGSSVVGDRPGIVPVGDSRPILEFCRGRSNRLSTYSRKSLNVSDFPGATPFLAIFEAFPPAAVSSVVVRA
jgi:hypothetical protein